MEGFSSSFREGREPNTPYKLLVLTGDIGFIWYGGIHVVNVKVGFGV
jgi:hypothetical protein